MKTPLHTAREKEKLIAKLAELRKYAKRLRVFGDCYSDYEIHKEIVGRIERLERILERME